MPVSTNNLKFGIVLEGAELITISDVPPNINENIGRLGSGMTAYVESDINELPDGSLYATTYILYDHPSLGYQNFFRVTDQFNMSNNRITWANSNIHLVVGIRLDNLDSIFDSSGFDSAFINRFRLNSSN